MNKKEKKKEWEERVRREREEFICTILLLNFTRSYSTLHMTLHQWEAIYVANFKISIVSEGVTPIQSYFSNYNTYPEYNPNNVHAINIYTRWEYASNYVTRFFKDVLGNASFGTSETRRKTFYTSCCLLKVYCITLAVACTKSRESKIRGVTSENSDRRAYRNSPHSFSQFSSHVLSTNYTNFSRRRYTDLNYMIYH